MKWIQLTGRARPQRFGLPAIVLAAYGSIVAAQTAAEDTTAITAGNSIAGESMGHAFGPQNMIQPFLAQFDVSLNGKYIGEAEMELAQTGDNSFEVRLFSKATKGAAGFVRARSRELARFSIENGQTRSHYYEKEEKLLFNKDNWSADFDWQQSTVNIDVEGDESAFELEGGELDSLSVYLVLADSAAKRRPWLVTNIITDDAIEGYSYQIMDNEQLDTACGPQETRVYQGILPETYKKVWTWHAESVDWLPVRVRKTRKGGDLLQLDLRAIESPNAAALNCGVIDRS